MSKIFSRRMSARQKRGNETMDKATDRDTGEFLADLVKMLNTATPPSTLPPTPSHIAPPTPPPLTLRPSSSTRVHCTDDETESTEPILRATHSVTPRNDDTWHTLVELIHMSACESDGAEEAEGGCDTPIAHHPIVVAASLPSTEPATTCEALLRCLIRLKDNVAVVAGVLSTLCVRTRTYGQGLHAQRRRRLGELGCCEALVAVMKRHAGEERVVEGGLGLMVYLAREEGNKRRLGTAGAARVICDGMRAFPSTKLIQHSALCAIQNLTHRDYINTTLLMGACEPVCACMSTFTHDREIQYRAVCAIEKLALETDNARLLAQAGACKRLCASLAVYRGDRAIVCGAYEAAINVEYHSDDHKQQMLEAGMHHHVCETMRTFAADRDIQFRGTLLLAELSCAWDGNNMLACGSGDGGGGWKASAHSAAVVAVLQAMKDFPCDSGIQSQGCRAIGWLSSSGIGSRRVGEVGACASVCAAMQARPSHAEVQQRACVALVNLSRNGRSFKLLGEAGACERVCEAVRVCGGDNVVLLQACVTMSHLAHRSKEYRKRLRKSAAEALLEGVLTHCEDETVRDAAHVALRRIRRQNRGLGTLSKGLLAREKT